MTDKAFDYTDGHFVLILASASANQSDIATAIFKEMYARYILNTHILTKDYYNENRSILYTYWPFLENHCGEVKAATFNIFENGSFLYKNKYLWPSKIQNFFGCPIIVGTFNTGRFVTLISKPPKMEIQGFEGKIINYLAKDMNFTINLKASEWGKFNPKDRSFTGVLQLVNII